MKNTKAEQNIQNIKSKKTIATGKTALVLSGGGARGAYQIGVWQAMRLLGINIDMVFGTSVGSINGAMVAQDKFEMSLKLWKELETDMIFDIDLTNPRTKSKAEKIEIFGGMNLADAAMFAREIISHGGAGNSGLRSLLDKYVDEDVLRNSPIEYGLTTVEIPSFDPHYLYTKNLPKGLITDFILASSAVFPAIKAQEIEGKKYIDGGFADVLPIKMALERKASRIICVYLDIIGVLKKVDYADYGYTPDEVITIESKWDLGNFLWFDKNNSTKLINLGYLDGLKAFGVLQGMYYSFPNGEFDKNTLKMADAAAKIFELNPEIVYKKTMLNKLLRQKIEETEAQMKQDDALDGDSEKAIATITGKAAFLKDFSNQLSLIGDGILKLALVIAIARNLRANPQADSFLFGKVALEKQPDEVRAARYLLKYGLV